jgi:hypothetical protein
MAMLKGAVVLAALMGTAAAAWAGGPDPAAVAAICAKTACRAGGYSIAVSVDKEHYTSIAVSRSPYVDPKDGAIVIFPGETLVFGLPVADGKIGTPVFVAEYAAEMPMEADPRSPPPPAHELPRLKGDLGADMLVPFPDGTFIVSYGQRGREPSTYMVMMHNLPKTVKLDALMGIIRPGKYEMHETSTCPVMPKMFGMENWPHPIGPMFLKNIHFLPDGAGMVCD